MHSECKNMDNWLLLNHSYLGFKLAISLQSPQIHWYEFLWSLTSLAAGCELPRPGDPPAGSQHIISHAVSRPRQPGPAAQQLKWKIQTDISETLMLVDNTFVATFTLNLLWKIYISINIYVINGFACFRLCWVAGTGCGSRCPQLRSRPAPRPPPSRSPPPWPGWSWSAAAGCPPPRPNRSRPGPPSPPATSTLGYQVGTLCQESYFYTKYLVYFRLFRIDEFFFLLVPLKEYIGSRFLWYI